MGGGGFQFGDVVRLTSLEDKPIVMILTNHWEIGHCVVLASACPDDNGTICSYDTELLDYAELLC